MQRAFERVLGREYGVVIEEELKELKQSERVLFGEPCAVLYRTDINLGRPVEECETEEKSCYIVFLPSKYSIVCNKDFESFTSKDGSVKFMSLNYFMENLLGFNFTFLQLIEPKAIIWASDEFNDIIDKFKLITKMDNELIEMRYTKLASIAVSVYEIIESGKIKKADTCSNRLFLLYIVCEACKQLAQTDSLELSNLFNNGWYDKIKNEYFKDNKMDILKLYIDAAKACPLNIVKRDKSKERLCKLQLKYKLMSGLISNIINNGLVSEGKCYERIY